MKTLLLGMGNPILTDDAVGVRLAHDIGERLADTPDLDVVEECAIGGLDLIGVLAGYRRLVVLDSIKTADGVPGVWYRFPGTRLRDTWHLTNVHDANFATTLELGRRIGSLVLQDEDVHVFAVEVAENSTFSESLSPPLEAAYPRLRAEVLAEIRQLLGAGACGSRAAAEGPPPP
jgi:hydrogenase maturation protease